MRHRFGASYSRLFAANALSAVGTGMTVSALPLLASIRPPSEFMLGIIAAAGLLPGVLLAVPAGLMADRYDRGRVLVMADLARAVVMALGALAVLVGNLPGAALALIAFLIGAGDTIFVTAAQSAVPSFVSPEHLDDANGHLQAADNVGSEFVGPPVGSVLFRVGTWLPLAADAVTYLVSAVLLSRLPRTAPAPATKTRTDDVSGAATAHDSDAGEAAAARPTMAPAWAHFRQSRPLVVLGASMLMLSLCGSAVLAMLVLLVTERLQLNEVWFGTALTMVACGATVAGVIAGRIRARVPARLAIAGGVAANAIGYIVLGTTRLWPVAAVALVVWGFAVTLGNITSVGIRQRIIAPALIGRVMGIFRAALGMGGVIGALGGGALGRATSAGTVAVVAGVVQLPVVAALLIGLPRGVGDVPPARAEPGQPDAAAT